MNWKNKALLKNLTKLKFFNIKLTRVLKQFHYKQKNINMNNNKMIILCNSPQCLNIISGGQYPNLNESNIFTCNLAYTHFRTNKRHLNIFSDRPIIEAFLNCDNWYSVFGTLNYDLEYVFHQWESGQITVPKNLHHLNIKKSPVTSNGSSAVNALLYLHECEKFDEIHLVGYTINEWKGLKNVKELTDKYNRLQNLLKDYDVNNPQPFVFVYKRKNHE